MSRVRLFLLSALAAPVAAQEAPTDPPKDREEVLVRPLDDRRDLTLLRRVSESTFLHEAARVSFTVPEGWKEIRPHRLNRKIDPRISTVLGIERSDRELVASLYWIPMNPDQKLSTWVRETPSRQPAGVRRGVRDAQDRLRQGPRAAPVRSRSGSFDVYRINITGGPDRGDKYDGVLFVFAVESGGSTWLDQGPRVVPQGGPGRTEAWAMEVLQGFRHGRPTARATARSADRRPLIWATGADRSAYLRPPSPIPQTARFAFTPAGVPVIGCRL